jgi:arginyl-tRNA synthetase
MEIEILLEKDIKSAVNALFGCEVETPLVQLQKTRKDFEGDVTLVVFSLLKISKKSPAETAQVVGIWLVENSVYVDSFNVVQGFLNLNISSSYWVDSLISTYQEPDFGFTALSDDSKLVMVEYSSPNTNKPLHLGHIRNNLLGNSICEILKATGNKVVKTNLVNDRGIHICKSMLAWKKWGNGQTPESTGIKGDHLVGDFYVMFDKEYRKQVAALVEAGKTLEQAEKEAPLMVEAREMLRKWEARDEETVALWKTMNGWVYNGFDVTYKALGVDFDKIYYESETYTTGRDEILRGLAEGLFYQKADNSVWADLTGDKLDHKILLRNDGTSVYMTQDIGTAKVRFNDYPIDKMVYVVGNEQNYHFQVLSILLDRLGFKWGRGLFHFSYGMVELPSGKMKSREGKVVDADDLVEEMIDVARKMSEELGKLENLNEEEARETHRKIALGALKYFILKVDPKKNMLFNPEESIDFNGNTGPFIQYTYARIRSVLRKAQDAGTKFPISVSSQFVPNAKEKELLKQVSRFPEIVKEAAELYSPALMANYCYELVKEYNQFYHVNSILNAEEVAAKEFRLVLSEVVADIVKKGMGLLGIEMPERM